MALPSCRTCGDIAASGWVSLLRLLLFRLLTADASAGLTRAESRPCAQSGVHHEAGSDRLAGIGRGARQRLARYGSLRGRRPWVCRRECLAFAPASSVGPCLVFIRSSCSARVPALTGARSRPSGLACFTRTQLPFALPLAAFFLFPAPLLISPCTSQRPRICSCC